MSIELGKIIKTAREEKGLDQVELGRHFGVTKSAVNQWESGKNVPDQRKQPRLAQLLDLDPDMVRALAAGEKWPPEPQQTTFLSSPSFSPRGAPAAPVMPVTPAAGPPDIPVWASAAAGDDGAIVLVPDPIDYIRRSDAMMKVRNPFAFNIIGSSMSPAIEHGNMVVINPSRVATPGDDCVFIHEGAEGMLALVKRLVRPGSDNWRVRQFNEPKDFDLSRKKWGRVHPISEIKRH